MIKNFKSSRTHFATGDPISRSGGMHSTILNLAKEQSKLGHKVQIISEIGWIKQSQSSTLNLAEKVPDVLYHVNHFHFCYSMLQVVAIRPKLFLSSDLNVLHFHGPWFLESEVSNPDSKVRNEIKRILERISFSAIPNIVTASDSFAELLTSIYKIPDRKVHTIGLGVDTDKFTPATLQKKKGPLLRIGTVRRLVPRMGLENLIIAMKDLKDFELLIAGTGTLSEKLEKLITTLNLEDRVKLVGWVSEEEIVDFYRGLDLCVIPTVKLEGFCLTAMEAMSCGIPVLASNLEGLRESVGRYSKAMLFDADSPKAIVDAVKNRFWQADHHRFNLREYAIQNSWEKKNLELELYISNMVKR